MPRMFIKLSDRVFTALVHAAAREQRDVRRQAAVLIEAALLMDAAVREERPVGQLPVTDSRPD